MAHESLAGRGASLTIAMPSPSDSGNFLWRMKTPSRQRSLATFSVKTEERLRGIVSGIGYQRVATMSDKFKHWVCAGLMICLGAPLGLAGESVIYEYDDWSVTITPRGAANAAAKRIQVKKSSPDAPIFCQRTGHRREIGCWFVPFHSNK